MQALRCAAQDARVIWSRLLIIHLDQFLAPVSFDPVPYGHIFASSDATRFHMLAILCRRYCLAGSSGKAVYKQLAALSLSLKPRIVRNPPLLPLTTYSQPVS